MQQHFTFYFNYFYVNFHHNVNTAASKKKTRFASISNWYPDDGDSLGFSASNARGCPPRHSPSAERFPDNNQSTDDSALNQNADESLSKAHTFLDKHLSNPHSLQYWQFDPKDLLNQCPMRAGSESRQRIPQELRVPDLVP